jgi:hypothetical protein
MAQVLASEVKPGQVITVSEGDTPILVKSVKRVGSFTQFTAFGHPSSDRWYVYKGSTVELGELTFTVEQPGVVEALVQGTLLEVA